MEERSTSRRPEIQGNKYGDLKITSQHVPESREEFDALIREAISLALQRKSPVIWVHLEDRHAAHIPPLIQEHRFRMHSVISAKTRYLRLCRLMHGGREHIVSFTNHNVRVECVVLHRAAAWETPRILCVRERYSTGDYVKLPTGHVDRHEFLGDAARRELVEETGLVAEYWGVLGFWENRFGSNELVTLTYGVQLCLHPKQNPEHIRIDTRELKEAFWMPIADACALFVGRYEEAWMECSDVMEDVENREQHALRHWRGHIATRLRETAGIPIQETVKQAEAGGLFPGELRHLSEEALHRLHTQHDEAVRPHPTTLNHQAHCPDLRKDSRIELESESGGRATFQVYSEVSDDDSEVLSDSAPSSSSVLSTAVSDASSSDPASASGSGST